jgi:DNA (cytosine-5)-methyltransferase 1
VSFTIGSLFDGSGGFPLAAFMCGGIPVWASEIEPYPIAVTKTRFPHMKHLGSVTEVKGDEAEPVDVITFGSPCQDLSVAGRRAGLKHTDNGDDETTRSGLFMEAVRIIKEMREATGGRYPRFALWENVPGAFSSNKGEDFRVVCEELIKIVEPTAVMPAVPKTGWPYSDSYSGNGWSLAYRVLDAQFWGVPQRRRRIYLILDLGGQRAGEISFKRDGLRGYFEESGTPWQGITSDAENGVGADDRAGDMGERRSGRGDGIGKPGGPQFTISCCHPHAVVYCDRASFNQGQNAKYDPQFLEDGTCATLIARGPGAVSYQESEIRYIVRRLTPTECARLQGFPDRWATPEKKDSFTDEEFKFWLNVRNNYAEINGKSTNEYSKDQMLNWYNKLHTDSSEYKLFGNGIALPCALYFMQGIAEVFE